MKKEEEAKGGKRRRRGGIRLSGDLLLQREIDGHCRILRGRDRSDDRWNYSEGGQKRKKLYLPLTSLLLSSRAFGTAE